MGATASKHGKRKKQLMLQEPKTTGIFEVTATGIGFHTDCHIGNSDFDVIVTEPQEKGGSGDGPNPVQYLVVSLTSCHQETAALIAKEKGIEKWGPIEFHTKFELNTDGFLGLVSSTLHAYDVFQRVVLNAEVTADVTQDTINEVYHAVKARCPLRALFESAGVRIEGVWKKKVAVMENE